MSKLPLAAAAGGGLLALGASDDTDAGLIFSGPRGARNFASRNVGDAKAPNLLHVDQPNPRTGLTEEEALQKMFKDLDEMKNPDNIRRWAESKPPFFDKLPRKTKENWDQMSFKQRQGTLIKQAERRIADHIHNYSTYDGANGWAAQMQKMENGKRNGAGYLTGLDISYEEMLERFPERHQDTLKRYTRYRLGDDNTGRRTGNGRTDAFGWKLGDEEHYKGLPFQHGATKEPKIVRSKHGRKKATGPVSFGMGAPVGAVDNHNAAVAQDMDNLGLTADPMYEYGTLLPYKQDITTGENSLAVPEIVRSVMGGLLSLGNTPKTGVYDPNALLDVVL